MMYQTHLLGGAAAGLFVAHLTGTPPAGAAILAAIGALVPDIDTPRSKGAQLLRAFVMGAAAFLAFHDGWQPVDLWILGQGLLVAAALPLLIGRVLGHRGATHSVLLVVFMATAAIAALAIGSGPPLASQVITFATVGYVVGGLALDACTIRGVPLLWPLRTGNLHLLPKRWRIRTDSAAEILVRVLIGLTLIPLCRPSWFW